MQKQIILMVGRIGSGKTTLADELVANQQYVKLSFAADLKKAAAITGGFDVELAYSREGKETRVPMSPQYTVGQFLQLYGTEVCRALDPDIWPNHMVNCIKCSSASKFIIDDCRFLNEANVLHQAFKKTAICFLTRETPPELAGSRDPSHSSETGVESIRDAYYNSPRFYLLDNKNVGLEASHTAMHALHLRLTNED